MKIVGDDCYFVTNYNRVTGATDYWDRHLVAAFGLQARVVRPHSIADGDITNCALPMEGVGRVFHLAGKSSYQKVSRISVSSTPLT